MSNPSTPSDSSVLAFTYDRGVHAIDYPPNHDESQPQTPLSPHTPRRSRARAYSMSLLDRGLAPAHSGHGEEDAMSRDPENAHNGLLRRKEVDGDRMDEFTSSEITIMAGSSLMVLALIGIAATLTLGKIKL